MSSNLNNDADFESILLTQKNLHSIRNRLNTILGYSQILQDEDIMPNEQNKMAISIEKAALNIRSLLSVRKEQTDDIETFTDKTLYNEEQIDKITQTNAHKILLVDDRLENLSLFKSILSAYNYDIKVASSGAEALNIIQNFHPELILLDIVMPLMDGYEVLKELKQNRLTCDIPVIFLTAKDKTNDIVKGFEEGAVDYIAKPFHPRELIARVHTHLQKAKLLANLKRLMEHSFHELYTPLSIISSAMQMQELEYKQTNYTQMALAACKTLQNIYDDLYYSINYASRQKEVALLDFSALLFQRINYFNLVATSRLLKFKTNLPKQMLFYFDQKDMERVIDNVISNALKYTKEDSDITISLTQNMDTWTFSICNPVQKDVDVKKIFQKYYRNNEEVFGLGLGLELVESICKENNININAICNNGQFCINMELMQTI
ncbi:MAG: hypothetical protein A2513_07740 [Sulfurimonas sp. RIFOXYD12_FULL_33_39]|uniref:hybrid sensor histidine kinase/response regulator n=1 Tax=unclassified Sulfurimonas TaxID=2623549 RepID=UPI0008D29048|nr:MULTISPECIES: hybrid sensor histidine kinase/response regulator [unclassified Sulfurimonas]OHE09986.1 MAG: hypothetical protein A2513_07740 [Sulfurimonas sp. RIFOXYD12_FULL_33_39]OHE14794.1 MAG: hypothetical protein A2530_02740 [Sulfurimonas sp. RIFOXYD2_FULL_34_21]